MVGIRGELAGDEGVVLADVREEAMDGKAKAKMDTGVKEADVALRRVKDVPVTRRPDLDVWPKKGFDQINLGLGDNREVGFGVPNMLVFPVPTVDRIGLGCCDRGRKIKTDRRRGWILSDTQSIDDWSIRRRRRRKNGRGAGGRRGGRKGNSRHDLRKNKLKEKKRGDGDRPGKPNGGKGGDQRMKWGGERSGIAAKRQGKQRITRGVKNTERNGLVVRWKRRKKKGQGYL